MVVLAINLIWFLPSEKCVKSLCRLSAVNTEYLVLKYVCRNEIVVWKTSNENQRWNFALRYFTKSLQCDVYGGQRAYYNQGKKSLVQLRT